MDISACTAIIGRPKGRIEGPRKPPSLKTPHCTERWQVVDRMIAVQFPDGNISYIFSCL